jgi:hypothetical protein
MKHHVSVKRIKEMKFILGSQVLDLPEQWPYYVSFITYMLNGVKADPKLYEELIRLVQKHTPKFRELCEELKTEFPEICDKLNAVFNELDKDSDKDNQNHEDQYSHYFTYFECRHPNKELYENQKLKWRQGKRKSHPDGLKYCCTLKPSQFAKVELDDENFRYYKRMIEVMNTNVYKCLDRKKQVEIWYDAHKMLVDTGWPERLAWEKVFADRYKSMLSKRYGKADQEGLKPDYSRFGSELNEALHEVFRSDRFKQIKLKPI